MDNREYEPEQRFVIDTFQKSFMSKKEQNIVLYGIGKNTEAVLNGTNGFSFCGLMDQNTTGQTIFDKKVLSNDEVIALHPIIIIIARESVVNIIFKRIQSLRDEYGIEIYDFQGNLLGQERFVFKNEKLPYWNASESELIEKIKEHDVISFDIFDTLLMRKVLQPEDVFALVERRLWMEGIQLPFASKRLEAEHALKNCPDLDEIYCKLQEISEWNDSDIRRMKTLEYEVDDSLLVRREIMCQIFNQAIEAGKKVYLISDMYYSKEYLQKVLQKNGIVGYEDIFVSCDIKREKSDGSLYQWYLSKVWQGTKLHVGDNRRADVKKAQENGIEAYHVYSAYELLMASAMQEILSNISTLEQKCILGLILSRLFNNPFVMYSKKGYVGINDIKDVGYVFVAPILTEFIKWFDLQVRKKNIQQILFPSRDGYLIKKVYEMMTDNIAESVYFRTSRRAASVVGIREWDDIWRIASRHYQGTYADYLKSRFGVDMDDSDARRELSVLNSQDEMTLQVLNDYQSMILHGADEERKRYLEYLGNKGILTNKRQAIFDFVAGGTVQYNLTQLLKRDILGLYFATMNLPNHMYEKETKQIVTAYGNIESYGTQYNLGKYYLFVETILVDDKATFLHIDEEGREVFEHGSAKSDYSEIEKLQLAVMDYVAEYKRLFGQVDFGRLELDFVDRWFGILFSKKCIVGEQIKRVFQNDDVYDGIGAYRLWSD